VFFACVPAEQAPADVDVDIRVLTGPELLAGSTRLKAGTATKMVLNMLTTAAFIRTGKTYGALMVDLSARSAKLVDRAVRIVCRLTGLSRDAALKLLLAAGGEAKTALVMHHRRCDAAEARTLLADHNGMLRRIIG
jgi:N-acetylmuramic acid 6-phosphate etherase